MEAEARRIGLECLRKKSPRLFTLRLDDDFGWDDGLICGGSVHIFINPFPERSAQVYDAALQAMVQRERAALCTFVAGAPDLIGQSVLVKPVLGVGCSVFGVRCSGFGVRCSGFAGSEDPAYV